VLTQIYCREVINTRQSKPDIIRVTNPKKKDMMGGA